MAGNGLHAALSRISTVSFASLLAGIVVWAVGSMMVLEWGYPWLGVVVAFGGYLIAISGYDVSSRSNGGDADD